MRVAMLAAAALVACGCSSAPRAARDSKPPAVAREFVAARFIPAAPSYAIAARDLRQLTRAITEAVDGFGMVVDVDLAAASRALRRLLIVDALSTEALANIGVDLDGGAALFSDAINPTLVVRLSSPEMFRSWLDEQRAQFTSTSQLVGDLEVFGAKYSPSLSLQWTIDGEWLWVHFRIAADDGKSWLASRIAAPPRWADHWQAAAAGVRQPAIVGFLDPRTVLDRVRAKLRSVDDVCLAPLRSVGRLGFAVELSPREAALSLTADVGPLAKLIGLANRPVPEGWRAAADGAPLAVEWNLDLAAVKAAATPCATALGIHLDRFDRRRGVRAARVFVRSFDAAARDGSGAVGLDLDSRRDIDGLLESIPLRSTLESARSFGPYSGRQLAIPFGPKIDYFITDSLAMAALGDGLLARVVGGGQPVAGRLIAIDVVPAGLSLDAWRFVLDRLRIPWAANIVERLAGWQSGHVAVAIDGSRLVLKARGVRP